MNKLKKTRHAATCPVQQQTVPSKGNRLGRNNPPEPVNSRVDYFFDLNDSTATIRLAKVIVIIKVS